MCYQDTEIKTLELDETARVVVNYDLFPEKPDWGNESDYPVFTIEYLGWYRCVPQNGAAEHYEDYINHALSAWGRDTDMIQRYLRAFHGATALEWTGIDRSTDIYSFDPLEAVEARLIDAEDLEARSKALEADLETWGAWGRGEVYTLSLERVQLGTIIWKDGSPDTDLCEWEAVETVGGYYGDEEITDENLTQWAREVGYDS